jgi:DNA-binding NtrC family response regulator
VELARRIADHIALALAHERLAEEAGRAARAQERASMLEERVSSLVQELEGRGAHRALGESAEWKRVLVDATKVAATDTTVLIVLPPLRDRADDIPLLADAFLKDVGASVGRPAAGISEDARDQLVRYRWPGNVRELRNAIERAVILCEGGLVTSEHLPIAIAASPKPVRAISSPHVAGAFPAGGVSLAEVERDLIRQALASAHNNKSLAARLLGLQRGQFYSLLRRHRLTDARR